MAGLLSNPHLFTLKIYFHFRANKFNASAHAAYLTPIFDTTLTKTQSFEARKKNTHIQIVCQSSRFQIHRQTSVETEKGKKPCQLRWEHKSAEVHKNLLLWNVIKNTLDTCCEHSKCFTFRMDFFFFFILFFSLTLRVMMMMMVAGGASAEQNFDFSFYLWPDFTKLSAWRRYIHSVSTTTVARNLSKR